MPRTRAATERRPSVWGVPRESRLRPALRVAGVAAVLALGWLLTPQPVPLYDGLGFPDQPYRFVPAKGTAPAATAAAIQLAVAGGSNTGGLIANSAELGPQVSVYAPPHAFRSGGTAPISLVARPVPPTPPLPAGRLDSNDYELSLTSAAGPVTVDPAAQPPAITLRSITVVPSAPVFEYRPAVSAPWQELRTRQVGRDVFNADAAGPGEYVLVQIDAPGPARGSGGGSGAGLYVVLGATAVLMALVIVGVRVMSKRAAQPR
jgi:hypothetical protein